MNKYEKKHVVSYKYKNRRKCDKVDKIEIIKDI